MSDTTRGQPKRNFRRTQGPVDAVRKSDAKSDGEAGKRTGNKVDTSSGGDNVCLICAENIRYVAVPPCNHVVCHTCAFRQRALYGKKSCLVCRTEAENVVFCRDQDASYESFDGKQFAQVDDKFGISFTVVEIADATLSLLKHTCPFGDEGDSDLGSYKKYNTHLKDKHGKTLCMICASHKKAFPRELPVFTPNQLRLHQAKGDSKGFSGHPMCKYCSGQRFYSGDELSVHMRDKHERCHICDRIDPANPQYFKNYEQLFDHFKDAHYICTAQTCLDNKFVVFQDELDLQAHILKEHGSILRTSNNSLPANSGRKYQSRLSTFTQPTSRNSSSQRLDQNKKGADENPEDTLEMKTKRMHERARHYLKYSHADYEQFLAINEGYKNRLMTAQDLFTAYQNLFKNPEANTTLLLYDFSELFFKNSQQHKDLRLIYDSEQEKQDRQNKFPSLSSSSMLAGNVIGGSWGKSSGSAKPAARQYNFPTLKKPTNSQPVLRPQPVSYSKSKTISSPPSPAPTIKKSQSMDKSEYKPTYLDSKVSTSQSTPSLNRSKFPPLPKPQEKRFRAPLVNEPNIPDPSQWSKAPQGAQQSSEDFIPLSNGKKKGKQKQLLFHIGI
ncbi:LADA_0G01464g1_1 [Lachancea dasiensis]|uniref:RING-type E3 ubiquitin transferase n=1 Tax=Lachancea dasiensis TaxID=1072105 RepID=A0A1G4JQZ6_9SACH|nr:LADA_0G01464g1_1 [Lachancea dasiensis]